MRSSCPPVLPLLTGIYPLKLKHIFLLFQQADLLLCFNSGCFLTQILTQKAILS